jgi:Holliday junction resolvase RusA-like endonuclease
MTLTMTRRVVTFEVFGVPQTKGSTRAFIPKGWTRPVITNTNPKARGWEQLVAAQAQTVVGDGLFLGPVVLGIRFYFPRPQAIGTKLAHHIKRPDIDKAIRVIADSLTGVLYRDDSQVVRLIAEKHYAEPAKPARALITVAEAAAPEPRQADFPIDDLFSEEALYG